MTTQRLASPQLPVLTSTVLAVVMRVHLGGPVPTEVHPHAIGHLTEPTVIARIRQQWDAAQYLAATQLPERVSQTWLAPTPGAYPLGVALRLIGAVEFATQWIEGRRETRTPARLRIRVDRLVWQRIGQAWFDAQQCLAAG